MIKQGIKEGVVKPDVDPFLVYDRPKAEPVNRRKLSIEEIRASGGTERWKPALPYAWPGMRFCFRFMEVASDLGISAG